MNRIIFCIDISPSMLFSFEKDGKTCMDYLNEGFRAVFSADSGNQEEQNMQKAAAAYIQFSDTAEVLEKPYFQPLSGSELPKFTAVCKECSTDIGSALDRAAELMEKENANEDDAWYIVLVTDGDPDDCCDREKLRQKITDIHNRKSFSMTILVSDTSRLYSDDTPPLFVEEYCEEYGPDVFKKLFGKFKKNVEVRMII